jgi:hypothetical protein
MVGRALGCKGDDDDDDAAALGMLCHMQDSAGIYSTRRKGVVKIEDRRPRARVAIP